VKSKEEVGKTTLFNLCTSVLVNLLPAYLAYKLLAALGFAALLAKNLMLTEANIANNLETMYKYLHIFIKLP